MTGALSQWREAAEEEPLEPDLTICDPHHHHWDRPDGRYMREELARDLSGHRVRMTVFGDCGSSYRPDGPEPLRPVGETEFVERIAPQRLGAEDKARHRIVAFTLLPLAVAYITFSSTSVSSDPPAELRTVHPAPPATMQFRGREIELAALENPLRHDVENFDRHVEAGRATYYQNCHFCHGDDLDGDGFDACVDCDDSEATVFPGAPELCDGIDND